MPERFRVVCTMQGAIQVLCFTFHIYIHKLLTKPTNILLYYYIIVVGALLIT